MNPALAFILFAVLGLIILVFGIMLFTYGLLWIQTILSGCPINLITLMLMRFRKVSPSVIVNSKIMAHKAGRSIATNALEAHYMAGGNVYNVVQALIAADRAEIDLPWKTATSIDLAGRDVLDAVQTSVNPKVIDCPNPSLGRTTIDAVAADGIQLKVRARVTVRANIDQLIGGATEETIIARVGEGIVSTIGSTDSHKQVLANPDRISKVVLNAGLDAETAFTILSIDIADVDVGTNIGAKLQADQAEADKRVAQAKAEERRAMAVAQEQENQAIVVLAQAEVPKAMAEAFRKGNLGIMDYYRMKNIEADTGMRKTIGGADKPGTDS